MLMEADKRGESLILPYSGDAFSIPENVYVIGLMNTADRSIALIDYALRRRFAFFTMKPGFSTQGFKLYQKELGNPRFDRLVECLKSLNSAIEDDPDLGQNFLIGHSFICSFQKEGCTPEELVSIVDCEIAPLLEEYWFDDAEKVSGWTARLREAVR